MAEIPSHAELSEENIAAIREGLELIGQYGRVVIIVEKGRIKFIETVRSFNANKWQPGMISDEGDHDGGR